jgi:starch synthase
MRYGTLPIVRETGGLIDTVQGYPMHGEQSTGFSFLHYTGDALGWAMNQALALYQHPGILKKLQTNAYEAKHDWDASSRAYLDLYARLI